MKGLASNLLVFQLLGVFWLHFDDFYGPSIDVFNGPSPLGAGGVCAADETPPSLSLIVFAEGSSLIS